MSQVDPADPKPGKGKSVPNPAPPTPPADIIPASVEKAVEKLPADFQSPMREIIAATFVGPMPPPVYLAQYDAIIPGAADRLLSIHEENAKADREIKLKIVEAEIADRIEERRERKRGQDYGLTIGMTTIILGFVAILCGQPAAGAVFSVAGVSGLVAVFVIGRKDDDAKEKKAEKPAKSLPQPSPSSGAPNP